MPDDPAILTARLERARQRAANAPAYSPDWDAAMALIEDLERRLAEVTARAHDESVEGAAFTAPIPI